MRRERTWRVAVLEGCGRRWMDRIAERLEEQQRQRDEIGEEMLREERIRGVDREEDPEAEYELVGRRQVAFAWQGDPGMKGRAF